MMNNPDDQSIPFPPVPIPFVVGQGNTAGSPSSQPDFIPTPIPIPVSIEPNRPDPSPVPLPIQTETILIAESLSKYADDGTAELRDVSFTLSKGELTCIMGSDEDGVSSLLRVLALEETVTTGRLTILNRVMSELDIVERNTWRDTYIAHIRQSHLVQVAQTARVLVAYWLHYYDSLSWNDAKEYAGQALNKVGITHHKVDIPIQKLSIAEVACVSIAKAYAHSRRNRAIYLFDDLFSSLDQQSASKLAGLLQVVAREGKVVVAQTTRQDIASSFDQVLEMRDGNLLKVR